MVQIGKIRFESFLWEVAFPPSLGNIPLTNAIIIKYIFIIPLAKPGTSASYIII